MARKSTGKRLRFEVFKRDGFRCVYCGATPTQVPLHADHVIPVADGGTTTADNLVTACPDCNGGKSDVPLERRALAVPNGENIETQREHIEQLQEFLSLQRELQAAKDAVSREWAREWEAKIGPISTEMLARVPGLLRDWPLDRLGEALVATALKLGKPDARFWSTRAESQVKYFYGCLRRMKEQAAK